MNVYGYEPFDGAKATYVWTGLKEPGFYHVEAWGEVPNFTPIVELVRDPRWVGGLKATSWVGRARAAKASGPTGR